MLRQRPGGLSRMDSLSERSASSLMAPEPCLRSQAWGIRGGRTRLGLSVTTRTCPSAVALMARHRGSGSTGATSALVSSRSDVRCGTAAPFPTGVNFEVRRQGICRLVPRLPPSSRRALAGRLPCCRSGGLDECEGPAGPHLPDQRGDPAR